MGVSSAAELLNLVGVLTGAALCAMLLALVLRGRAGGDRDDPLPLLTAVLGLVWNLGELADDLLSRAGIITPEAWLNVISFAALAILAAVVVHSVARGLRHGRAITAVASACAIGAVVVHVSAVAAGELRPSPAAFAMLTAAFGAISVPLAIATRRQTNGRRALWMLALALFAVSANHVGHFHDEAGGWLAELLGHNAVLPLSFAILYQEYRFALADLFLKQALTLLAVVAVAIAAYAAVSAVPAGPLAVTPAARRLGAHGAALPVAAPRGVDVRRLGVARTRGLRPAARRADPGAAGVRHPRRRAGSHRGGHQPRHERPARLVGRSRRPARPDEHVTAEIAVPTSERPTFVLRIGELVGGRRLLSDDRAFLDAAALAAARRIDAVRLSRERFDQRIRQQEMERLATEAELRALRSQINPHFLFNTLTTIGYLIETAPPRATKTLLRLTSLLRSVLRSEGEFTTPRARSGAGRALPRDRARAVRGAAAGRHRRAYGSARAPGAVPAGPAAGGERRQTRHRAGDSRRRGARRGAARRLDRHADAGARRRQHRRAAGRDARRAGQRRGRADQRRTASGRPLRCPRLARPVGGARASPPPRCGCRPARPPRGSRARGAPSDNPRWRCCAP